MKSVNVYPIGKVESDQDEMKIVLDEAYREGLKGLSGFSHALVLWWADGCDNPQRSAALTEHRPYKKGPEELGVFATRSECRPNPIAVTCARITWVDEAAGTIGLDYIDAFDGSPVLDVKPYTPSVDRVEHSTSPAWCSHWPQSREESGEFDWAAEFNF